MPPTFPPITATANVNSNGVFIEQTGFSSSTHPVVGQYVLTLLNPPIDDNFLVVNITLSNSVGGQVSFLFDPPLPQGVIRVFTFNGVGVPTDLIFSIVVLNLQ